MKILLYPEKAVIFLMEDLNIYLEGWQTFYEVVALSSASLMGLIFLSVSLHLDLFKQKAAGEPRQIAWQTFINFFWVFTISLIFLLPRSNNLSMGLIILLLGFGGEYITCRRWWLARKHLSLVRNLIAFVPLFICYMGIIIGGFYTTFGLYQALICIAPIAVFLIGISIRDAWRLLINTANYTAR